MKVVKLRWWTLLNAMVLGLGIAAYNGGAAFAWSADATKLSFITLGIFAILTGFIGHLTINQDKPGRDVKQDKRYINACWFGSEFLMGIGLTGTVLGIIMMFVGAVGGLDPSNVAGMRSTVSTMSVGLTTCFITTLMGVVTSMLTKLQLVNYEVNLDDGE